MTRKIFAILSGLLILIFIEGMMTLGHAFQFESYSIFAWVVQALAIGFAITASLLAAEEQ